jgi:acyl transferase domain-containing protein
LVRESGDDGDSAAMLGNLRNLIAARVSHVLDLTGPALAVDTACSSALVALHLARRSLNDGECDIAIVAGVNLNLTPMSHRLLGAAQALSPTGRCRAFSDDADGFVPGEGGAAIVLARTAEARRRGDSLLAVVRGSAVNNDGGSLSLLAPNPLRQREVIADAYRTVGVDPDTVSYVECHGTGTAIGDPVEIRSLKYVFARKEGKRPLRVGSVKTNLGHLLNAAAMPGLVKVVLSLQHGQLPPSLHFSPSSRFDQAAPGIEVVAEPIGWEGPRTAGVNAFGFGGTNAHAILEAAEPSEPPSGPAERPGAALLTLSARTAPALRAAAARLAEHLRENPHLDEADVCASASTARDDGPHRLAVLATGELANQLTRAESTHLTRAPRVAFVFPCQDTGIRNLARALHDEITAGAVLTELSAQLGRINGRTLSEWSHTEHSAPLSTEVLQSMLVACGIAVSQQLAEWGVRPDAVLGHSVGELTAACVSGRLTPEDVVSFAATRGRLVADLADPGAMLAVGADQGDVEPVLGDDVWVAAVNGTRRIVLAGTCAGIERVRVSLHQERVPMRQLSVSHAFHTPLLEALRAPLAEAATFLTVAEPVIPQLSTVPAE